MFQFSARKLLLIGIGILVLILLLVLFVDWPTVFQQLRHTDLGLLAVGVLLLVVGYIVYAVRWHVLLVDESKFIWTFHAANAGSLVNFLLPLRPGDAARILMLGKKGNNSVINVTTSIVVERWYEQILRIAAIGGAIVFGVGMRVSVATILGSLVYLAGMLGVMVWMVRQREWLLRRAPGWLARIPSVDEARAFRWIETLLDGLTSMAKLRTVGLALFWSVICWVFFWGYHYLTLIAIFPDIDVQKALGLSLGSLALVPPSATTLPGVYQVSLMIPLGLVGFERSILAAYALVLNAVEMLIVILLGWWGVVQTGIPLGRLLDVSLTPAEPPGTEIEGQPDGGVKKPSPGDIDRGP